MVATLNPPLYAVNSPLSWQGHVAYPVRMTDALKDSALMLRYRDGDVDAFRVLYERHNDSLYRYLLRLCKHRDTAEDLYQEVWSKIIKSRQRYRPTAKFTTFLYRVAHNCFIDHIRRNKRHTNEVSIDPDESASSTDKPEQVTEQLIARERLNRALAELPREQRNVVLLFLEAGLSLDKIAGITGVNRETAKSRLRYATTKLKAALADPETDPSRNENSS